MSLGTIRSKLWVPNLKWQYFLTYKYKYHLLNCNYTWWALQETRQCKKFSFGQTRAFWETHLTCWHKLRALSCPKIFRGLLFAKHCARCCGFNKELAMHIWVSLRVLDKLINLIYRHSPQEKTKRSTFKHVMLYMQFQGCCRSSKAKSHTLGIHIHSNSTDSIILCLTCCCILPFLHLN